nr:hypothetical protein [Streptomyces chumphonensis]
MPAARRTTFDREIRSTLGTDPYGHGSTARGEKDRREIVIAGAIVIYYVSQAVAMVTAVTIISV